MNWRIKIIGNETFNILDEFDATFARNVMNGSGEFVKEKEFIILNKGVVLYSPTLPETKWDRHLDINGVKEIILNTESTKWRSDSNKEKKLNHLRSVLSKMISINRDFIIDEVLSKETQTHYDILCYAC